MLLNQQYYSMVDYLINKKRGMQMRRIVSKILLLVLVLIGFSGCGKKFNSREDLRVEKNEIREKYIIDVLNSNEIKAVDKYSLMFINFILTESKIYPIVEKLFPYNNYNDFLQKVIPILYYSHSYANYQNVPANLRDDVNKFLINHTPYNYSYGEKKFRENLSRKISNNLSDDIFKQIVFKYSNSEDIEQLMNLERDYANNMIITIYWYYECSFNDFKFLSPNEQSYLIYREVVYRIEKSGGDINKADSIIKRIREKWENNSEYFLQNSKLRNLSPDAPMDTTLSLIIDILIKNL